MAYTSIIKENVTGVVQCVLNAKAMIFVLNAMTPSMFTTLEMGHQSVDHVAKGV
jgi:hypothetical protein